MSPGCIGHNGGGASVFEVTLLVAYASAILSCARQAVALCAIQIDWLGQVLVAAKKQ